MTASTKILGVIPARYESTRFPGKPLALLKGKAMIRWVYEGASDVFDQLVVATDDERILHAVHDFGGQAVMTSKDHRSGTERCAEALELVEKNLRVEFSHIVNIQGDEPLVSDKQLKELIACLSRPGTEVATLVAPFEPDEDPSSRHLVKVVVNQKAEALYFSRALIPYPAKAEHQPEYLKHIGLYGFSSSALRKISKLPTSQLELSESLEQLRWLDHGMVIRTAQTSHRSVGVDTPEELEHLNAIL